MDSAEVCYRPASKAECGIVARLYSISSDGVADYIWSKLAAPGEDLLEVGRRRYERESTDFSYENCTMAEIGGEVAGMLVAFPMNVDSEADSELDPVLVPFDRLEEDNSYYICGVAMLPEHRGRGVGSRLMALAEEQALELGFEKLSLIVFEQNVAAHRLYQRLGYKEVAREPVVPHPLIHVTGDAILMVKHIP